MGRRIFFLINVTGAQCCNCIPFLFFNLMGIPLFCTAFFSSNSTLCSGIHMGSLYRGRVACTPSYTAVCCVCVVVFITSNLFLLLFLCLHCTGTVQYSMGSAPVRSIMVLGFVFFMVWNKGGDILASCHCVAF